MISREHNAIFVHIPKAAGSSIEQKLGLYSEPTVGAQDHRTVRCLRPLSPIHIPYLFDREDTVARWDSRKRMAKAMLGFTTTSNHGPRATREQWNEYFKFAVVRNPWARVYSWYRNVMRDPHHGISPCSFSEFLHSHSGNWALQPQTHWLLDFNGEMPLDRVVRFENLADEMADILDLLGFDDTELPHLLKGKSDADYRSAYSDSDAEIVAHRYEEEISLFGYDF